MAHAGGHCRLRLPDRDDVVWAAFVARLLSHAAVVGQSLGPRRVRLRAGAAESALGHRPAARRHDRRPLRNDARPVRGLADVRHRSRADGACHERACAGCLGRRLIGFGLSGCSFMVLLAAFGKLLPPEWRSTAFGFGTAAGSFGQFLYSPVAVALMDTFGWQQTLTIFAVTMLAIMPLSLALVTPTADRDQGGRAAIATARASRGLRSPLLRALGARAISPAVSSSPSSPSTCLLIWSTAACRCKSAAGRWRPSVFSTSSDRSHRAGSATACRSIICFRSSISCARRPSWRSSRFRSRRFPASPSVRRWD